MTAACLFLVSVLLPAWIPGLSETPDHELLFTGNTSSPLYVRISSPEYQQLAAYDEQRVNSLNLLLSHLSVGIRIDGSLSETEVMMDDGLLYSVFTREDENGIQSVYSFEPETCFLSAPPSEDQQSGFSRFLESDFFYLNRFLDWFYNCSLRIAETYQEFSKSENIKVRYSGFRQALRRVTIVFSNEFVKEQFPQAFSAMTDSEEFRTILEKMVFEGPQKMILLLDEDGNPVRINYDGRLGLSRERLRKVSLVWKSLREDGHIRDVLTLKTPSVQGNIRDNIIYSREILPAEDGTRSLQWDCQLDRKTEQEKSKIRFEAKLDDSGTELTGLIRYSDRTGNQDRSITICPAVQKENGGEYAGTLEITDYSGKIITSSILFQIRLSSAGHIDMPDTVVTADLRAGTEDSSEAADRLQDELTAVLIRGLMTLPGTDLDFFSREIPESDWKMLLETMY